MTDTSRLVGRLALITMPPISDMRRGSSRSYLTSRCHVASRMSRFVNLSATILVSGLFVRILEKTEQREVRISCLS